MLAFRANTISILQMCDKRQGIKNFYYQNQNYCRIGEAQSVRPAINRGYVWSIVFIDVNHFCRICIILSNNCQYRVSAARPKSNPRVSIKQLTKTRSVRWFRLKSPVEMDKWTDALPEEIWARAWQAMWTSCDADQHDLGKNRYFENSFHCSIELVEEEISNDQSLPGCWWTTSHSTTKVNRETRFVQHSATEPEDFDEKASRHTKDNCFRLRQNEILRWKNTSSSFLSPSVMSKTETIGTLVYHCSCIFSEDLFCRRR